MRGQGYRLIEVPRFADSRLGHSKDLSDCLVKIFLVSKQRLGVLFRVLELWGSMPSFEHSGIESTCLETECMWTCCLQHALGFDRHSPLVFSVFDFHAWCWAPKILVILPSEIWNPKVFYR